MITSITKTKLDGVLIIQNKVYNDLRGCFLENYREDTFNSEVCNCNRFVQDNISLSNGKNVIRGLHYQLKHPQAKLVSVLDGCILDVVVDIRKDSPTFKQYVYIILEAFDGKAVFIPEGFAHGFKTLNDGHNIVNYKTTDIYYANDAYSIAWNDQAINIDWSFKIDVQCEDIYKIVNISEKDKNAPSLKNIDINLLPSLAQIA